MIRLLLILMMLPSLCWASSGGLFPATGGWVYDSGGSSTYKLEWDVASDALQTPSTVSASRTGSGVYTTTGCVTGGTNGCYDNVDTASSVNIPITSGDTIDQDNFDITFYFNPQLIDDYDYVFAIGVDLNNKISVHMYATGRLYLRCSINTVNYSAYLLPNDGDIVAGTWYKVRIVWSDATDTLQGYVDDVLLVDNTAVVDSLVGTATAFYFGSDYNGGSPADTMIDDVTVEP